MRPTLLSIQFYKGDDHHDNDNGDDDHDDHVDDDQYGGDDHHYDDDKNVWQCGQLYFLSNSTKVMNIIMVIMVIMMIMIIMMIITKDMKICQSCLNPGLLGSLVFSGFIQLPA